MNDKNSKSGVDDKSIDQLLAEYQELENSVKPTDTGNSKVLNKKAAEIQEMESNMGTESAADIQRRDKSMYSNPYIALVPKINSNRDKQVQSKDTTHETQKENTDGRQVFEYNGANNQGDAAALGSDDDRGNQWDSNSGANSQQQEDQSITNLNQDGSNEPNFEFLKYQNQSAAATIDEESVEQSVRSSMPEENLGIRKQNTAKSQNTIPNQNFGKRKGSQTSHLSKGSNPVLSGFQQKPSDKLQNLGSVLGARKSSGQRNQNLVQRRPSGSRNDNAQANTSNVSSNQGGGRGVGMSPMSQNNSRLRQRKNSGNGSLQQSQDGSKTGTDIYKLMKRPPSQSSKSSGGGLKKNNRPPITNNNKKQNPMISLTGGQNQRKMGFELDKKRGSENETQPEPDNDYLETMKLRMGAHLPTNTTSQQGILKNLRDKNSEDVIEKAMDNMLSEKSSNKGGSRSNREENEKLQYDPKLSQSMATLPHNTEFDPDNLINGSNGGLNNMMNHKTPNKKPKSLMSKYANLMKQTKSSAIRNAQVGKISSMYSQDGDSMQNNTIEYSTKVVKRPAGSPKKNNSNMTKSPNMYGSSKSAARKNTPKMSKMNNTIGGRKQSPNKRSGDFNIGLYGDDQNYLTKVNCEQLNLEFKWEQDKYDNKKFKTENQVDSVEGISGMVIMSEQSDRDDDDNKEFNIGLYDDELKGDIKKGESISEKEKWSSGSANSDPRNVEDNIIQDFYPESNEESPTREPKNLDIQMISVDSNQLEEFAKKANINEINKQQKSALLDNEILSIISSINLKSLKFKSIMGLTESQQAQQKKPDSTTQSKKAQYADDDFEINVQDPLGSIALELSAESSEHGKPNINDMLDAESNNTTDVMDQTIIIGDMEDMNIFDDIRMNKDGDSPSKEKEEQDENTVSFKHEEFQSFVDGLKLKHRAEIDAIMIVQTTYQKIIAQMVSKYKNFNHALQKKDEEIIALRKYEFQAKKYLSINESLKIDVKHYRSQIDKFKISLIEYDRHIRESVLIGNELMIQQLETENSHLRKLLNIPEELFLIDPEEEKKKAAEKKKNMLKSIDDKLKQAEKKIHKKQSAADIYYQQQKEHGFDPFELDQEEYDMYRMSKLKDHGDMPKDMKDKIHQKIYGKMEERNYREEMRRQHEKDILEEFARAYGYDVNKHQPNPNNGEIEVEYLQAYIAQCRAEEEKQAKEQSLKKEKESLQAMKETLKGKVNQVTKQKSSENKTGTKSSTPAMKKPSLTLETGNFGGVKDEPKKEESDMASSEPAPADEEKTDPYPPGKDEPEMGDGDREEFDDDDEDDDLARAPDESPMTREKLEQESSNSVQSLDRIQEKTENGGLSQTLSSQNLKEMQVGSSDLSEEEKSTTDSKDLKLQLNNSDEAQNKTYVDDDDEKDTEESKNAESAMRVEDQELSRSSNQTNLHDPAPAQGVPGEGSAVSKHIQDYTADDETSPEGNDHDPYSMGALGMTLGDKKGGAAASFENPYEDSGTGADDESDPYSNSSGLGNTMEGFGKSKKSFNAVEMFGVAPVEEDKDEDQEPKKSEVKTDNDNKYSEFDDLEDDENDRDEDSDGDADSSPEPTNQLLDDEKQQK